MDCCPEDKHNKQDLAAAELWQAQGSGLQALYASATHENQVNDMWVAKGQ